MRPLKAASLLLAALATANACTAERTATPVTTTTEPVYVALEYSIRDTGPAGGVIYFASERSFPCGEDLTDLCNYLEASPQSGETRRAWGPEGEPGTGADESLTGTGHANTSRILAQGNTDPATSAAAYAAAYELNGFDDWYLPSKDEAFAMLVARELIGGFTPGVYWTSTERDDTKAWYQSFENGFQFNDTKRTEHLVRPIRAF